MTIGWLRRSSADVPTGDDWLSDDERRTQSGLVVPKRRADWRLGRWTAKSALASVFLIEPDRCSVAAAADGAPEALIDGRPSDVSLSISHREGIGLAVVGRGGVVVGGDLEVVEPRSDAFVREWLAPAEQAMVERARPHRHHETACLIWSAKEAAAKVLREGLRLDVRRAVVSLDHGEPGDGWHRSSVEWVTEGRTIAGWWRIDDDLVTTLATDRGSADPTELRLPTEAACEPVVDTRSGNSTIAGAGRRVERRRFEEYPHGRHGQEDPQEERRSPAPR